MQNAGWGATAAGGWMKGLGQAIRSWFFMLRCEKKPYRPAFQIVHSYLGQVPIGPVSAGWV